MKRRFLIGAAAISVLGALGQDIASAGRLPSYDVVCAVGVQTTVNWSHAKLDQVTIQWVAPAGSAITYQDVVVPVSPHPPRGFVITATPTSSEGVNPESAFVLFEHANGSGTDRIPVACK
jgi:hypothetical protein